MDLPGKTTNLSNTFNFGNTDYLKANVKVSELRLLDRGSYTGSDCLTICTLAMLRAPAWRHIGSSTRVRAIPSRMQQTTATPVSV